jgi:hypothetical protein
MAIRITRNNEGNCITFIGSSNPAYWNACLSAELSDDAGRFHIINDLRSANEQEIQYEFYNVEYTDFADADGNDFTSAQEAVDYINANANVIGLDGGVDMTGQEINFRLDQTSTSILSTTGSQWGVNSVKAVLETNGLISIHSIGEGVPTGAETVNEKKHYRNIDASNVSINGTLAAGGPQDVVNAMNELFTVGPFESIIITDPAAVVVANVAGVDAGYTLIGTTASNPIGDDVFANSTTGNLAGLLSTATIDQTGEYFTFDIRNEGQIGFGLVHTQESYDAGLYSGSATYANPTTFAVSNSAHYGFQFSHWFHPTPNGSWTNYGASTGFVYGSGWSNWESQDEWLAGDPVKVKVGIDENSFIAIYTLQDNDTDWILHARTSYPVKEGAVFQLGIKSSGSVPRVYTAPKVHLRAVEETAPTDLGDQTITVFEDNTGDVTGTLAGGVQFAGTDDGNDNDGFVTTETISAIGDFFQFEWAGGLGDANVGLFSDQDHAVADLQADRGDWSNADYIYFGARTENNKTLNEIYYEEGGHTALASSGGDGYGRVGFDAEGRATLWYSSDGTTWTAYRRMNQSAPTGTYRFIWVAQGEGELTSLTKGTQSFAPIMYFRYIESPDGNFEYPLFVTEEEANYYDLQNGGTGTSHTHTYSDDPTGTTWYMPDNGGTESGTSAPAADLTLGTPASYTEITSLTNADQTPAAFSGSDFTYEEGTAVNIQLYPAGATFTQSVSISPASSGLVYDTSTGLLQGTLTDVGSDTTYTITVTRANAYGSSVGDFTITATDVAPATTMLTPWTKALDFSGSSEYAVQVNGAVGVAPIRMGSLAVTASAPGTAGNTSSDTNARPWATAIVFKSDGNSSNQHIWNQGEGASTGDDNIYVRQDASGNMYFGWGRSGALNECRIGDGFNTPTQQWFGLYVAHNGTRLSGVNSTAANLADAFDIRFMRRDENNNNVWEILTGGYADGVGNRSTTNNWNAGTTGGRMDRSVEGYFSIGGRRNNRNFHGKVASMVVTTLRTGVAMPADAEIEMMITDPKQWEDDYRVGQFVRWAYSTSITTYTPSNYTYGYGPVQIWLMGDGGSDSYANGIRNEVYPSDQNNTKLQLNSMVSNDIQTVTIPGLS